jgi:hypothetical protein
VICQSTPSWPQLLSYLLKTFPRHESSLTVFLVRYYINNLMASIPHGGVLKVHFYLIKQCQSNIVLSKDLLVRDEHIRHALKEESLVLEDIVLTEVGLGPFPLRFYWLDS